MELLEEERPGYTMKIQVIDSHTYSMPYGLSLIHISGRAHTAYVASAADARHAGHNDLRRYAGQPGRLCGGLLGTAHTGQRVAQQQRRCV